MVVTAVPALTALMLVRRYQMRDSCARYEDANGGCSAFTQLVRVHPRCKMVNWGNHREFHWDEHKLRRLSRLLVTGVRAVQRRRPSYHIVSFGTHA